MCQPPCQAPVFAHYFLCFAPVFLTAMELSCNILSLLLILFPPSLPIPSFLLSLAPSGCCLVAVHAVPTPVVLLCPALSFCLTAPLKTRPPLPPRLCLPVAVSLSASRCSCPSPAQRTSCFYTATPIQPLPLLLGPLSDSPSSPSPPLSHSVNFSIGHYHLRLS